MSQFIQMKSIDRVDRSAAWEIISKRLIPGILFSPPLQYIFWNLKSITTCLDIIASPIPVKQTLLLEEQMM